MREARVYVTLEPCAHHGKTPPCADLLIAKGVPEVVICNDDPFALVAGRGIAKLRAAGVRVETGLLAEEGRWLNRRFFTFHEKKRPYLVLKWAETADGFLAGRYFQTGPNQRAAGGAAHPPVAHRGGRASWWAPARPCTTTPA